MLVGKHTPATSNFWSPLQATHQRRTTSSQLHQTNTHGLDRVRQRKSGYIGATGRYHYTEAMIMAMCGLSLENHSSGDSHSSQLKNHPMETLISAMRRLSLKDIPIPLMSRQQ